MYRATFNDGSLISSKPLPIGVYTTRENAVDACHKHAVSHQAFKAILSADLDNSEDGFDMAVQIGASRIRLYAVDRLKTE
jgi:hypothetical protein